MSTGLALDANNDIFIEGVEFRRTKDAAYVAQKVRSTLKTILGESDIDPNLGVPYFSEIFQRPVDVAQAEALLKDAILGVEGVNELLTFETDFDSTSRYFSLNFSADTIYGDIEVADITINI